MKIFGIDVNVSNLFEGQTEPYSFMFAVEGWVQIHGFFLMIIYIRYLSFKWSWWILETIGYIWESGEAITFGGFKQISIWFPKMLPHVFVTFFGEQTGDSAIGDPIQDTIGNTFAWYFVRKKMKSPFLMRNGLWNERNFRQQIVSLIQFGLLAATAIPSIIFTIPETSKGADAYVFGSIVPIGWWCYGIGVMLVLLYMRHTDLQIFAWKGYGRDIREIYDYIFMYFLGSYFVSSFFFISSYFPLWVFYPFFFIFINLLPQRKFGCEIYIEPCSKEWILDVPLYKDESTWHKMGITSLDTIIEIVN